MSQHKARFTWGVGPEKVFVAGGFNNWSGDASPLEKQADGTFAGDVEVPWGEKQAFKYVVDGEWKVREDEAKEWDAAGNMNNVYTAPHKPETAAEPAAAAAAVPASSTTDSTKSPAHDTLATGVGSLGAPIGGAAAATESSTTAPTATEPTPVQIEKTAATSNVGAAPAAGHEQTLTESAVEMSEKAAEIGAGALAALGAAVGGAIVAAEKAIGVDVTHSQPLTIDEAKAKGIDVNALEQKDAATDAVSPVGSKPSAGGVAALEEKAKELKLDSNNTTAGTSSVPLPAEDSKAKHDIPAQNETGDNHKTVPAPVITAVSAPDPSKDRSLNGAPAGTTSDSAGTKPIDSDPAVSAVQEKKEAEQNPALTGSTLSAVEGKTTETPTTATGAKTETQPSTTGLGQTPGAGNLNHEVVEAGAAVSQAHNATGTTAAAAAAAENKETPAASAAAPATPAKKTAAPTTATSTPAKSTTSTPAKDADGRKRKPSFFKKMKEAFSSPKDKEKK